MQRWQQIWSRLRRGPTDVVGLDVEPMAIYAVRMLKTANGNPVTAVDELPLPGGSTASPAGTAVAVPPLIPPPALRAPYAALTCAGAGALVKFMSFPGPFDESMEEKAVQNLGLGDASAYRIGYKVTAHGHGKAETQLVVVAVREEEAQRAVALLPSGLPAPLSVELADSAILSAFLAGVGAVHARETVAVLHVHMVSSILAFFKESTLVLVRRFEGGLESFLSVLQRSLGIDRGTADNILTDAGSFDLSQAALEAAEPLLKQAMLSRDFVERREACHLQCFYVSGGPFEIPGILEEVRSAMGTEVRLWNPWSGLKMKEGSVPKRLERRLSRFNAAIGACLGTFDET